MAQAKKHMGLGILLAISFWIVLFLMFLPIFPKTADGKAQNGLEWADEMFNQLAKGSSYFIPKVQKNNEKFMGKMFSVTVNLSKPEDKPGDAEKRAERASKLFMLNPGATVAVNGADLKIDGDLGLVMKAALDDADMMFKNEGDKIKAKYAEAMGTDDVKQMFRQWNNVLPKIDKAFKKEKLIEEAKIVSDVTKKAIEASYNFYPSIALTQTLAADVPYSFAQAALSGATVVVTHELGTAVYAEATLPGTYVPHNGTLPLKVEAGALYTLDVTVADGRRVRATTRTPQRFSVPEWLLLDATGTTVERSLASFAEYGDGVFTRPENQLEYAQGLLEARFDPTGILGIQVGLFSRSPGSPLAIDPDLVDEEDLDRINSSPPFEPGDGIDSLVLSRLCCDVQILHAQNHPDIFKMPATNDCAISFFEEMLTDPVVNIFIARRMEVQPDILCAG